MATKTWLGTDATSPNDVTVAANWSPSGQPTAGDDVIITGAVNIDGAVLSASGNLASLVVRDYNGTLGSATTNLTCDIAASGTVTIDTTGRAYLDFNASDTDVTIYRTLQTQAPERAIDITHTSLNDIHVYGGSVRILSGTLDGNLYTYSPDVQFTVAAGAGVVDYRGPGVGQIYGAATNLYVTEGGIADYYGTSAITTAEASDGAFLLYLSDQNIGTANAHGGTIDGGQSNESVTVTSTSVREGGSIIPGRSWTISSNPTERYVINSL